MHYKVKTGDTLVSIANKFQTTPKEIRQLNRLTKNTVRHGNHLLIPSTGTNVVAEREVSTQAKPAFVNIVTEKAKPTLSFNKSTSRYIMQPGDTVYMVRKKDSLASISKRFRINGQSILAANRLKASLVLPGTQLIIPTHRANDNRSVKQVQPGDTIYMVRRGDTIKTISRKFHTTPSAVRLANLIDDNSLQEGVKIIVPTGNRFRA